MHELSLAVAIVQMLEGHAHEFRHITRVTLDIGAISCVDAHALRTALHSAMAGTLAAGADVLIETVEARARCHACGQTYQPPDRIEPCPHCGAFGKTWLSGEDFKLRRIEGTPPT